MPRTSEELRETLDAFRRIVQALRVSARDAERRVGLSGAQLFALQQLSGMPGASINDLAAATFTHQSSVSVVVRQLVERRLVAKLVARDDRRRVVLALTETGRALLRRSPQPVQHQLIAGIAALSQADRRTLARALSRIAQQMADTRTMGPAPMLFEEGPRGGRRRVRRALPSRARGVEPR